MYTLTIDDDGSDAIAFIGYRYAWSSTLQRLGYAEAGTYAIPEHVAWDIATAIDEDMEGEHSAYPMLDPRCKLAESLTQLYQSII